ncbi:helix-turn-helix domain-containing protein [Bacillus cytotoxicus]|uniref:helix-turn-helix domain-containing protein n=1 Tax=Bacillus cytotoxicus TaxID=580165 RepID=UPI003D7EC858
MMNPQEITENFAKLVEYYRVKKGISQNQLAEESGVSASLLSRINKGTRKAPTLDKVYNIAKALDIPLNQLFEEEGSQVSKHGSKKEFIFTLFLKKFPEIIENVIGHSIEGIKTEVNYGSKYIDFYAVNREKKIEIFVENQIKPSDRSDHLKGKITPIINSISEGYLIWIAAKFQKSHIDEVKQLLRDNPQKYINFYAVEINEEVLNNIDYLNTIYELDVWNNLDIINKIEEKVRLVDCHIQMPQTHMGKAYVGDYEYDFKRDDDIKEFLSVQLCEKLPFFLNFHTQKKHLMNDRILKFGAGVGEVTYFCSAFDKKQRAIVGIRFEYSKQDWYQYFKQNEKLLKKYICPDIYFDDENRIISHSIKSSREIIPEIVDYISEVFRRFILFFSPYTYGGKLKLLPIRTNLA